MAVAIAEACIRVEFAVCTDKHLTCGYVINLISLSECRVHGIVGGEVCTCSVVTIVVFVSVCQSGVGHFIIHGGVCDYIISVDHTGVGAPTCVKRDAGIPLFTFFGGYKDYAVCTAGSVQGGCCCVFENRH